MKKFTAVVFVCAIMIFLCLVCLGVSRKASEKIDDAAAGIKKIDWQELYPFHEKEKADIAPAEKQPLIDYLKERVDKYTSTKIPGSNALINTAKKYEDLIRWNMTTRGYNPVFKLHDGHLSWLTASKDISENIESVKELDKFCQSLGIKYIYVNIPLKVCVSEDKEISGTLDFTNQNAERLLDTLGKAGVKYYDLHKMLHDDGMNHHKAFFVTDHHWKPETGLWAAKHILEFLRDDYGWNVDPEILNPDSFEHKVYPDWFLGSQGKKVTLVRAKPEDFTILYPKFKNLIHFEAPARRVNTSGDFSVTYDMEQAATKDYYRLNPYGAYKYADQPLSKIHNLLNHDGKRILFLHDSSFNCVIPFVCLGIEYTDDIDLRLFSGSVRSYIKSTMPDIVITAYNAGLPGTNITSNPPNNKFYDFR